MTQNEKYIFRCLELAKSGMGSVAPNPMVGCIIIYQGEVIGEGYHKRYGESHAEVNAINSVLNPDLLKQSTLYVSLEPCAHHGITPPCSDLIVEKQIPKVVIGTIDSFAKVAGKGIEKLKKAGIEVKVGILKNECRELNKRFFTFHEKKRPYIILKWAQTLDGFIDIDRTENEFGKPTWITSEMALHRVHKMRAEEDAVIVGTNTAQKDNPSLTVRLCDGQNPTRIVLDRKIRLKKNLNLFDNSVTTLVFNSEINKEEGKTSFIKIDFSINILHQILKELHNRRIQSLIVEGGKKLLESFIKAKLWDEAHVFEGNKKFQKGIQTPKISGKIVAAETLNSDTLAIFKNEN